MTTTRKLAVDVGGVLASKQHDGEPVEGSLEAIKQLSSCYEVWVTSQCGRNRALKTREWLEIKGFPIPKQRQIYIGFDEKNKNRVLSEIKADEFIDDRLKHIWPALSIVDRAWHLAPEGSQKIMPKGYHHVTSWREILEKLL